MLFDRFPELETAYDLKEAYIEFNKTATLDNAAEQLEALIQAFEDSGIPEYIHLCFFLYFKRANL